MTARASSYLLPAVLAVGMALSSMCPVQASSPRQQDANEWNKRGIELVKANDLDKALEAFNRALELFRQAGDRGGEAKALVNIGFIYATKKEWGRARECYTSALDFFRNKPDRQKEAELLCYIASTFHNEKNYKASASYYRQAIPLLDEANDRGRKAAAIITAGSDLLDIREQQEALDLFLNAVPFFDGLDDPSQKAQAFELIALIYYKLGKNREALRFYKQVVPNRAAAGEKALQAGAFGIMADIERELGDLEQALRDYNNALAIWRSLNDETSQQRRAALLSTIAGFHLSLGDLPRAHSHYDEALSLWQSLNDPAGEAGALDDLARFWGYQGKYDQALSLFERSLALRWRLGQVAEQANTLAAMGTVCEWAHDYRRAAEYLNQSLALCRQIQDRVTEVSVMGRLGMVYVMMFMLRIPFQSATELQDYLDQSAKRVADLEDVRMKELLAGRMGLIYTMLGDTEKALAYHRQALRLAEDALNQEGQAFALFNIGYAYETGNNPTGALKSYEESISIYEKMRSLANLEEIKTGLSGSVADAYKRAAVLCVQAGNPDRAFDLSERARARTLLDQLANLRPRAKQGASAELRQEEQVLRSELSRLENQTSWAHSMTAPAYDPEVFASLQNQLKAKRSAYENLLLRLKLADPEYASLRSINTLTLPKVQALVGRDTTLLSYFVTSEQTLIFVITRDSLQAARVEMTDDELKTEVDWFRQFAAPGHAAPEVLKRLYKQLIAPVSQYIKTPTVTIIPHGVLNYLPFAALTDGQHYFGEQHVVHYLPSASVLPFIQKASRQKQEQPTDRRIMVVVQSQIVGSSPLQYADKEASAVANLYGTKALGKVSKAAFLKQAGDYAILHIAAHGELDSANPLFSRIWLAQDEHNSGALAVHEVYDLDLRKTDLVVLSACETQLGAQSKGDDITGLNRAFLYAGAASVIASLWTVDDQATGFLMRVFYTHLKRGMGKAEALRAAQSETRRQYPNPYYWAAFVLTGDAGPTNHFPASGQRPEGMPH